MMFSGGGMRGFGMPGQRSTSVMSFATEVWIAACQCAVGAAVWLVLAFIIQRVVVINIGDAILRASPESFAAVVAVQTFIWRAMALATLIVHLGGLGTAMAANVLNPNYPAPFAAQNPADVVFPSYLRWLLGMGWMRHEPQAQQEFNAPTAQVADHVIRGESIHIVSNNGRTRTVWNFELPLDDLDKLRLHFYKCQRKGAPCGVSVRDLEGAGFGKGKEGRARAVAEALRAVTEKQGARVVCIPAVVEWVLARKYAAQEE